MGNEFKGKFDAYLKTRGVFFFCLFLVANLIAYVDKINLFIDIFSHFRLQYLFLGVLFLVMFLYLSIWQKKFILPALISFILIGVNAFGVKDYIGYKTLNTPKETIKLGVFNVFKSNVHYEKFLKQVDLNNPDIIIVQETDENWLNGIKELKLKYPYNIALAREDNFGAALYSKVPLKSLEFEYWTDFEVPVVHTVTNSGIEIFGVHTLPPVNSEYLEARNEMLQKINLLSKGKKVIICGDFNTTIYSPAYKKYIKNTNLKDAQVIAKNITGTWNARFFAIFRVPLEHILYSNNFQLKSFSVGGKFNSDHLPVFAEIGL